MTTFSLAELVQHLDSYLRVPDFQDYPNALNGLQVENRGRVRKVGAAVDASAASIEAAAARRCDLLIVHHGLFWDGNRPLTGRRYRRARLLLDHDIAVYSAHLPLDAHPEVGNNAVLARELGIHVDGTFGNHNGVALGVTGDLVVTREALCARLDDLLGRRVLLMPGGPERIRRVGVITGGAGSMVAEAAAAGLDAFVTGEGAQHTWYDAMEGGINVYYGGHYATETFGVRALAAHLEASYGIPWEFLDVPVPL